VAANVFNVGATLEEVVSVDDEPVAVAAVPVEVVEEETVDDGVVAELAAASSVMECDEPDPVFAVTVVCSGDEAGAVDEPVVCVVCVAPPAVAV